MPRPVGILCPLLIVHSGLSPGQTLPSSSVMVHLHCQLDWIWNRLGDTPLWVSVWAFPERLAEEGKPTLNVIAEHHIHLFASRGQVEHDQLPRMPAAVPSPP